jgi:hypothetical protein
MQDSARRVDRRERPRVYFTENCGAQRMRRELSALPNGHISRHSANRVACARTFGKMAGKVGAETTWVERQNSSVKC